MEERRRHLAGVQLFRLVDAGPVHRGVVERAHVVEHAILIAQAVVIGANADLHLKTPYALADPLQAVRRRIWKRAQQNRVHDAEHGRIRADADGQRERRGKRQNRIAPQPAKGVAQVLQELLHQVHVPCVPALLLALCHAIHGAQSRVAGLLRRPSRGDLVLDPLLEMKLEFAVEPLAPPRAGGTESAGAEVSFGASVPRTRQASSKRMIREIAPDKRSQLAASRSSAFRPRRVSE